MLIRRYGDPDVFELGEHETPRPQRGEVLVFAFTGIDRGGRLAGTSR